jgi:phosphomethylpyrimidine synthase
MKITQEVRDYAESLGADDIEKVLERGMEEKAKAFVESGSQLYL